MLLPRLSHDLPTASDVIPGTAADNSESYQSQEPILCCSLFVRCVMTASDIRTTLGRYSYRVERALPNDLPQIAAWQHDLLDKGEPFIEAIFPKPELADVSICAASYLDLD
jgi:hypothetical protein